MDYSIVELPFIVNEDGSSEPLFKVVDSDDNDIYFGNTIQECEEYINSNK